MSRWHESGCRRPSVGLLDNMPCCNYCFAIASHESTTHSAALPTTPLPKMQSRSQMNLTWPSVVHYSGTNPDSDGCSVHGPAAHATPGKSSLVDSIRHHGDTFEPRDEAAVFPKIAAEGEIRLLRLKAGQPEEPVHAHVEVACLRNSSFPSYEALSYTRADDSGDYTERRPIFIGPYWDIV